MDSKESNGGNISIFLNKYPYKWMIRGACMSVRKTGPKDNFVIDFSIFVC
jgi:hypothetical protein